MTSTPTATADPSAVDPAARPAIELVAIDVDGTLLRSDKRLSRRVRGAILASTARGVAVVLATARPPRSMREIHGHLQLQTPLVNYNGALIHDPIRGRHLHHQPLSPALAAKVIKLARKTDPDVVVSVEILDKWYTDHLDETLPTETSRTFAPDFIGPLEAFLHVPVTKLMLLAPPPRMLKIREAIQKKFGSQVGLAVSDDYLLQVIARGVDKSVALARLAGQMEIPASRVMAIGDAPNDVGMLRWAGLGVAMRNGWDLALQAAKVVAPSNDEDGVAEALETYVLG